MTAVCTCHYDEQGELQMCSAINGTYVQHIVRAIQRLERERALVPDDAAIRAEASERYAGVGPVGQGLQSLAYEAGMKRMRELLHPTPPMSECEAKYREWFATQIPNAKSDALNWYHWPAWQAAWEAKP